MKNKFIIVVTFILGISTMHYGQNLADGTYAIKQGKMFLNADNNGLVSFTTVNYKWKFTSTRDGNNIIYVIKDANRRILTASEFDTDNSITVQTEPTSNSLRQKWTMDNLPNGSKTLHAVDGGLYITKSSDYRNPQVNAYTMPGSRAKELCSSNRNTGNPCENQVFIIK